MPGGGGGAATGTPCHPNKAKHFIKSLCGKPGLYSGAIGCANVSTVLYIGRSLLIRRTLTTISVTLFLYFNLNQKAIELNNVGHI